MVATTRVTWSEDCRITNTTVAKTWITSFFDNLAACGLVQTSDTGQLDPSTIAGEWLVEGLPTEFTYDAVCRHADFNDLIWSNVVPKPM